MDLFAHLEAYVAVAEEGSFSKAADLLYVAQPVLSRRIKTLEEHFGGELFDRSRRQVTSTELGVLLLPHAKDVLGRVDHLRQVARAAVASAAHTLGVPPDIDPAALARIIRTATQHGVTIHVRELPAEERAAGLAAGALEFALLRVPPEAAAHHVPLGLGSAAPATGSSRRRPVHLESLRPRRGTGSGPSPAILVTTEDQIGFAVERFDKAAARAGLAQGRVRHAASTAAAVAETLAGQALLVCTEPFAHRHDLAWSPFADTALHRGYEFAVAGRRGGNRTAVTLDWMQRLLTEAIGAVGEHSEEPTAADRSANGPDRARLAARG